VGDITTNGTAKYSVPNQAPISPMSWYSGSQLTNTSVGRIPSARPIARMLARTLAWVSTTPFGWPVLPDVYWRNAMSRGPGRHAGGCAGASRSSATDTISRSDGVAARSSSATACASGTVTSIVASALSMIFDWRRKCSSSCERRAGG